MLELLGFNSFKLQKRSINKYSQLNKGHERIARSCRETMSFADLKYVLTFIFSTPRTANKDLVVALLPHFCIHRSYSNRQDKYPRKKPPPVLVLEPQKKEF